MNTETPRRCEATDDAYGRCLLDTHDGPHAWEGVDGPPGPPQRWQTAEPPGGGGLTEIAAVVDLGQAADKIAVGGDADGQ